MTIEDKEVNVVGKGDETYLGSWKTREAAEEGLAHKQALADAQAQELGTLRKQAELSQQMIDELKNKSVPEAKPAEITPDYSKEQKDIQVKMSQLDIDDQNYQKDLMDLMGKSNALVAKVAQEKTLAAATTVFKNELNERDVKAAQAAFYKDNPDFNTPEMQVRIKEQLAKDTSGMGDALTAYREIQRDDAMTRAAQIEEENAKLKEMANVREGGKITGKVVVSGGNLPPPATKPKLSSAEVDAAMAAALRDVA